MNVFADMTRSVGKSVRSLFCWQTQCWFVGSRFCWQVVYNYFLLYLSIVIAVWRNHPMIGPQSDPSAYPEIDLSVLQLSFMGHIIISPHSHHQSVQSVQYSYWIQMDTAPDRTGPHHYLQQIFSVFNSLQCSKMSIVSSGTLALCCDATHLASM